MNLGPAVMAFTRDVANDYVLDKSYGSLDKEDFDVGLKLIAESGGEIWRISKHVRFWMPILQAIPVGFIMKYGDPAMKEFFGYLQWVEKDTEQLMKEAESSTADHRNIVHEIVKSKLPPAEKSKRRILDDVSVVASAGIDTTAATLRLTLFNIYSNPMILDRLRVELASVCPAGDEVPELKVLEQLPFLTATITEGLRLSPAIGGRLGRVANRDLFYDGWRIPAGTPVSMTLVLMHTDSKMYEEPFLFRPERWMDSEAKSRTDSVYAPFSRGTRDCLGRHLAWAELYLVLATLVNRYDFQYHGATADDFLPDSDAFAIGTKSNGDQGRTQLSLNPNSPTSLSWWKNQICSHKCHGHRGRKNKATVYRNVV
ncbi:cytochrome P450 [Xylariaceae sp. FL1019]|nr:cytochrome P450 [Xylariaceae sp. FL1019]